MLHGASAVPVFTDHRNLLYVFCTLALEPSLEEKLALHALLNHYLLCLLVMASCTVVSVSCAAVWFALRKANIINPLGVLDLRNAPPGFTSCSAKSLLSSQICSDNFQESTLLSVSSLVEIFSDFIRFLRPRSGKRWLIV